MPLNTTVVAGTLAGPFLYNDFKNLLTGSMTDQAVTLRYQPASGTTAVVSLYSKAGNPLLQGYKPDGVTQAFLMDENGNLTLNSITTAGGGLLTVTGLQTTQSGAANNLQFKVWTGAAGTTPFAVTGATTQVGTSTTVASSGQIFMSLPSNSDYLQMSPSSGTAARWTFHVDASGNMLVHDNSAGGGLNLLAGGGLQMSGGSLIQSGAAYLGFKDLSGNKLFEMKAGGNIVLGSSGTPTVFTPTGSWTSTTGGYDAFDVAEAYPMVESYPVGTVVCLDDDALMRRCEHDHCPFAHLVSLHPGVAIGFVPEEEEEVVVQYISLVGRVQAQTAEELSPRTWVVSDGHGGVRAALPGETHVLGYTLGQSTDHLVGIFVK